MTVHTSLAHEIEEILSEPGRTRGACQRQLIVAARMVSRAPAGGTTAATVVGVLGRDDPDALRMVVRDICDEFGLDATVGLQLGSFSVRFFRPSNTEPA
ncbi:MAG: hypothetical protein JO023_18650 [Chloroflexi bacterium]|nr:hypothetical protein [Chloroflexota bacterium]